MTARRAPRSSVRRTWEVVRIGIACSSGGHQIPAGAHALFTSADWRRSVLCERHAWQELQIARPGQSFGFHGEAPDDVRSRQSGGDE